VRLINGIIECPGLRPDGSVIDSPGWDATTGLLYIPNQQFPPIPAAPTQDDARKAARTLLELIEEFPFAGDDHRAAWLAALLTVMGRTAIDGCCPLFSFEASVAGSGKTLLCDVIGRIKMGRDLPRSELSTDAEEMRKLITAIAVEGDQVVLLDNASGSIGCAPLDEALTGTTWQGRILGKTKRTSEMPMTTVWFCSGNNLSYKGDLVRRVIPCRLEPEEERPEERSGFKVADLRGHVREHRAELVVAALTILKAHALAGRPQQPETKPLGSYEVWCKVIRAAVWWATGDDPAATREDIAAEDRGLADLAELLDGWSCLPGGIDDGVAEEPGITAAAALRLLQDDPDRNTTLRTFLSAKARKGKALPEADSLGYLLRKYRGRVVDGRRLERRSKSKRTYWYVRSRKVKQKTGNEVRDGGIEGHVFPPFVRASQAQSDTHAGSGEGKHALSSPHVAPGEPGVVEEVI
jgi:hypothetical protein